MKLHGFMFRTLDRWVRLRSIGVFGGSARFPRTALGLTLAQLLSIAILAGSARAADQPGDLSTYGLFARDRLTLDRDSSVHRGNVGANDAGASAKLRGGVAVADGSTLVADRVSIASGASVDDVFAGVVSSSDPSAIRGAQEPGQFPVLAVPAPTAGTGGSERRRVRRGETVILAEGAYEQVIVDPEATLILAGGLYDLASLKTKTGSAVFVAAPSTILVRDKFQTGKRSFFQPLAGTDLGASDITVEVQRGPVSVGRDAEFLGTIFAPDAKVSAGPLSKVHGSLVGRTVLLGRGASSDLPICGDGTVDPGEHCDGASDALCPGACEAATCICTGLVFPPSSIELTKLAEGNEANACPGLSFVDDAEITYEFVVKNTGAVALQDLVVTDDALGLVGMIPTLPAGATETLSMTTTPSSSDGAPVSAAVVGVSTMGVAVSDFDVSCVTMRSRATLAPPETVSGEAYGIFVDLTPVVDPPIMVDKTPVVVLPPNGGMESDSVLSENILGALTTGIITVETEGSIAGTGAEAQSTTTVAEIDILAGVVTAQSLVAMASSSCGNNVAESSAEGSGFVGLTVAGVPVLAPAPNTEIAIPGVGRVILNEQIFGGNGINDTELTVNMIHLIVDDSPVLSGEIVVGSAHSDAHCPPITCEKSAVNAVLDPTEGRFPGNLGLDISVEGSLGESVQDAIDAAADLNGDGYILIGVNKDDTGELGGTIEESIVVDPPPGSVSGEAYGVFVDLTPAVGPAIFVDKTPVVVLPASGGMESDAVVSESIPGALSTGAITVETQGTLVGTAADASSTTTVATLDVLSGVITADSLVAMATSSCDGGVASSSAEGSGFTGLTVGGIVVGVPAPNTVIPIPGVGTVILNEQIFGGDGVNDTELTVNMIRLIVDDSPTLSGEIIVGSAHSDAHCELPFGLIGCAVTLLDPTPLDAQPTALIPASASSPDLFVMDLYAAESNVAGWLVEGDGRTLRNVSTRDNGVGVWFSSADGNVMKGGLAEDNSGPGVLVVGDGNVVEDVDAMGNGGNGVEVVGDFNTLRRVDAGEISKGNGQDGIHVLGAGNDLFENDAYANGQDGIDVGGGTAGSPNELFRNDVGDVNKGNGAYGMVVGGTGNGVGSPVEIDENTAKSNVLNGFRVTGTNMQLQDNTSGGTAAAEQNGICEYLVAPGNINSGGNRVDGVTLVGSGFNTPPC